LGLHLLAGRYRTCVGLRQRLRSQRGNGRQAIVHLHAQRAQLTAPQRQYLLCRGLCALHRRLRCHQRSHGHDAALVVQIRRVQIHGNIAVQCTVC